MTFNNTLPGFVADAANTALPGPREFRILESDSGDHILPAGARGCGFGVGMAVIALAGQPHLLPIALAAIAGWC